MSDRLSPSEFVNNWRSTSLGERQSYQGHFRDLCKLVAHPEPDSSGVDKRGRPYGFEWSTKKSSGGQGFADVYYGGHFAMEYKAPGKYKDLSGAYDQLLQYRENLNNPPLLVVTDIDNWEIHTNFPNTQKRVYQFKHSEIAHKDKRKVLWQMFHAPEQLHPKRNTEQVTAEAAEVFRLIADNMRRWAAEPQRIAHFLTKLVFCLFAEDVGLLPIAAETREGIVTHTIRQTRHKPNLFTKYMRDLFQAMADGSDFLMHDIPYFNGTLFDDVAVEELSSEALTELEKAAMLNWEAIEPSIFGTLFERSLDPRKRSQLGAHYTSREDILLIVEPALMAPLRYQWDTVQLRAEALRQRYDRAKTGRALTNARNQLLQLRENILNRIRSVTVLDPACGSGNFLYVSLQLLMDMEKEVINHPLWQGLQRPAPEVHPRQMYGIELDPIAHALASIVVWIGYIQWRGSNGYMQSIREPILETLQGNIVCKDAILAFDDAGRPAAPAWPAVDVIMGNPPFLGGQKLLRELGGDYVNRLRAFYSGRVSGGADLVCYWFEKAREQIENGQAERAGLLATNSIRGGLNREVLKRIKDTGDIFMAWSNREWILEGAAVRVSMVGFDKGLQAEKTLNGLPVANINPDLSATVDITVASPLAENKNIAFQGPVKVGKFDIANELAQELLKSSNVSGMDNFEVIKPFRNGNDLVKTLRNYWIIDFQDMEIEQAQKYKAPFEYVEKNIKPIRANNKNRQRREKWWRLGASGRDYRKMLESVARQIFTSRVAKYRVFVWVNKNVFPDSAVVAIARDDDYFFGVLHSKLHEVWSLRMGTSLEDRPRYTPTTTFQTFPFPWPPGKEDQPSAAYQAISRAAKQLNAERHAWLNPAGVGGRALKERTLTNLYNALQVFRGLDSMKAKAAAADFAPRLDELHQALDVAVCAAYGWGPALLDDDEEILRRLLAQNLVRG